MLNTTAFNEEKRAEELANTKKHTLYIESVYEIKSERIEKKRNPNQHTHTHRERARNIFHDEIPLINFYFSRLVIN